MADKQPAEPQAANGLLGRRAFLGQGLAAASLLAAGAASAGTADGSRAAWMSRPGRGMTEASPPSVFAPELGRVGISAAVGTDGAGASRTPLEHLDGLITPSRLHFERHHSGIPAIDPTRHHLLVHGRVERPLLFSLDALHRYPMVSRIQFLECSGNSGHLIAPQPPEGSCGELHGLVSNSEWGGVPLGYLLEEARVKPGASWIIAGGADAAAMARSIPMDKILDDAIVALYQNGEPLRAAQGYPMRLFLPGWEGNASVKWLRSLYVADQPAMTRDETAKYTDVQADGTVHQFTMPMGVKSVITSPSPGKDLGRQGVYQISGLAWSGAGRIRRVEVSADGGRSWADALLDAHALPQSQTRFRCGWRWQGQPGVLVSRATDEQGNVQPTRTEVMKQRAAGAFYHYNAWQAWAVNASGVVRNVYV